MIVSISLYPEPSTPPGTLTPGTALCPGAVPGGLPAPDITKVLTTMNADQRLYWGVVIFWVARKLLISEGGRFSLLLRKQHRLRHDQINITTTNGATQKDIDQKL